MPLELKEAAMPRLHINTKDQLHRLDVLRHDAERVRALPLAVLLNRPAPRAWSIIEIVAHLNVSYEHYRGKIDRAFTQGHGKKDRDDTFKARILQQFLIDGLRPKGTVRKWKVRTLGRFNPLLDLERTGRPEVETVFDTLTGDNAHLARAMETARNEEVSNLKVDSALGPLLNFYLPECFEFLLCHMERHWVQLAETERAVSTGGGRP